MKKMFGMAILAIFLVSLLPSALAQGGDGQMGQDVTVSARQVGVVQAPEGEEGAPEPALISAQSGSRETLRARVAVAQERYLQARARYQTVRARHQETRASFAVAKEEFRNCKGEDTPECADARRNARAQTRNVLSGTADRVIAMMEKVRERIELSDMDEDEKADRIAAIDEKIADLEDAKETSESLGNESTAAEIRTASREMKQSWKGTRATLKVNSGKLLNNKMGGIVVQMEKLSEKLGKIVARLEGQGHDVSAAEGLIADFNAEVASAGVHQDEVDALLEQKADSENVDELMKEVTTHMSAAKEDLKEARVILRSIVQEIKGTSNGETALEEETEEPEEGSE